MKKKNNKLQKIGFLTPPVGLHSIIPLTNILDILSFFYNSIFLITGNEGFDFFKNNTRFITFGVNHNGYQSIIFRIISYFLLQINISRVMLKHTNECNPWFFFLGAENLIIPMFIAKIFRKRVILIFAGSSVHTLYYDNLVFFLKILSYINCKLCSYIVIYSTNLINEWNLTKYKQKIIIAHEHIIDFNKFNVIINYEQRKYSIGYIGRLSKEKGIEQLIQAIPLLMKSNHNLEILIGGDGQLMDEVRKLTMNQWFSENVNIIGWINHNNLPQYLNSIKLLILPSFTEGLPNIVLEAMACGTPVLATPVGAIPEIITNEKTGFILESNSPDCIVKNVFKVLNYPNIENIIRQGKKFVEEKYSLDNTLKLWNEVLLSINNEN